MTREEMINDMVKCVMDSIELKEVIRLASQNLYDSFNSLSEEDLIGCYSQEP